MRFLVLGSRGQVGWELCRALAPLGDVLAPGREEAADLSRPEELAATVHRVAPDVIVNAAAYTAVDQAESEPELAHTINAEAPAVLARQAKELGAWLVHYSTDYVFDGSGERPWRESDRTGPINIYGRTKLAGEQAIRASGCAHLIFRTSWVYAAHGKNFLRTMLRLANERDTLQVIDDQHGAPTGAELIADTTAHALPIAIANPGLAGLYHLAADGETTWHGYACSVIAQARASGWPVNVAEARIAAVATDSFAPQARRPKNSRLDCKRLEEAFGLKMPGWRFGVHRVIAEILACESAEACRQINQTRCTQQT